MPKYDMAIIVTIEADNFVSAESAAKLLPAALPTSFFGYKQNLEWHEVGYYVDFEGNRVIHLHPSDQISEY